MANTEFKPSDVDLSLGLCSTFGKSEVEEAATHLIEHLAESGDKWHFTFAGLYNFYIDNGLKPDEMLFGLLGPWFDDGPMRFQVDPFYVGNWGNGLQVTESFLERVSKHVRRN